MSGFLGTRTGRDLLAKSPGQLKRLSNRYETPATTRHWLWLMTRMPEPPFGADDGYSPIISQGTPMRSICALTPSASV
jgi:hypothetical protein